MATPNREQELKDWNDELRAAEHMVPIIGTLWRERHVPTYIYGAPLYQRSPIEIIKAHRAARRLTAQRLLTTDTLAYLQAVADLDLSPARVDIGKLVVRHRERGSETVGDFVAAQLEPVAKGAQPLRDEPQDVVLYGFGRVGRLLARILMERLGGGDKFRLKGIVVRKKGDDDLTKRASLLRRDSVHGPFEGTIAVDEESSSLIVNGSVIRLIDASSPDRVDYEALDIRGAIVIDNTGVWRDREGLSQHLKAKGADKVILTAPGKGDVPNIVVGVNDDDLSATENIVSAASCTTNAISPLLKVVHQEFGVISGHIETCHAFTNDQNLIDNYHMKKRRGRSAALNMVITETGAAKAVSKALPELKGKLTGSAIRVPTANVSLAILTLRLDKQISREDLNEAIRQRSLSGSMQYQLDYTSEPDIVSSDIIGSRAAVVLDAEATIVHEGHVVLYGWYDNEYGYACQVTRLMERMAGVKPQTYPRP